MSDDTPAPAAPPPAKTAQRTSWQQLRSALRPGASKGHLLPALLCALLGFAVVAALDAVFGGLRALLDGIFDDRVFVVSFIANVLVAALIVYLGDQLGVGTQLSTGVVVVLGIRIFSNAAAIRRQLFRA